MQLIPMASSTDGLAITTELIEPIVDYITGNIAAIMPVGITILGIMVGLGLVPRIIRMFTRG